MGGGYIELGAGADGRYLLIRASEWDPSITIRQPGVSRGVGEMALAGALAAALQDGGATAHALWLLAQDMQGFGLPAPSSPRADQAVIEAIGTAVRLRRVLVIRGAHLPGASEIEGDTPSMVRAVTGAVEPVRAVGGQAVASMGSGERWLVVLQKMPSHLSWEGVSREARANAEAFFQPETLAMLAAGLAVMAMNPAGAMALLAGGLLLSVSLFFAGQAALEGAAQIADVFEDVEKAKSESDLDRAARKLATGVEKIGVEMFIRIICRAGPKKRRGGSQQVQASGSGGGGPRRTPGQTPASRPKPPSSPSADPPPAVKPGHYHGTRPRYTVDGDNQGKHLPGHRTHRPQGGRSELDPSVDPQALVDRHSHRGTSANGMPPGQAGARERFDNGDEIIGIYRDARGASAPTTRGIIHYGADGRVHIVPARPRDWIDGSK